MFRLPVYRYSVSRRAALRREIASLRTDIRREGIRTRLVIPAVAQSLSSAESALSDADNMLNWGYRQNDVRAAIEDARGLLDYARKERAYTIQMLDTYHREVEDRIERAERAVRRAGPFGGGFRALQDAHSAYRDAEVLMRTRANADTIVATYERAADLADRAFRDAV